MWNFQREELSDGKAVLFRFEHPIHQVLEVREFTEELA